MTINTRDQFMSAMMNKRYEKGASNANFKLKLLNDIKNIIFDNVIYIGLFLFLIFFKRYKNNKLLIQFFNMILLFWAISNLMMNVSNGNRYQIFQITLGVVFFVLLYQTKMKNRIMNTYFVILFPLVFLFGLMSFDVLSDIYHGGDPDLFFVLFEEMKQLTVRCERYIDVVSAAYAVKQKYEQCV
jgi:hypothetical protein